MKLLVGLAIAAVGFASARAARTLAKNQRPAEISEAPFAPARTSARFISLGYHEVAADVFFVRLRGYFGGYQNDADGIASLCEAIVELDSQRYYAYEFCARAMTLAKSGVDQSIYLRAIALLERGIREFPSDWKLPHLAGQIYTQDLVTNDPKQRRDWDERGTLLVESAIRKPGAPAELGPWAALMRTKFGQTERAAQGLRELLLVTSDTAARKALIAKLAELENKNADAIAAELLETRRRFDVEWKRERPMLPATWFILLGARPRLDFDMTSLATGGRDLVIIESVEPLDPAPDNN